MALCSSSSAPAPLPWMELKVDAVRGRGGNANGIIDECQERKSDQPKEQILLANDQFSMVKVREKNKLQINANRKPARILIPDSGFIPWPGAIEREKSLAETEMAIEGHGYCLLSRIGRMHAMEDGYGIVTNIDGDPKQAFFGVFDGHGGRAAVDYVSDNLGKNIIAAIHELAKVEDQSEMAVRRGYMTTDHEFLRQGLDGGVCAASVLLKDGELHAANVGDCRVVMCRKGVAEALTDDHRAGREDERSRIESSGGYVTCRNGKWRVQDSLAVSRAIGDRTMKQWIISEPGTTKISATAECEFLILATDGLWDKVTNQEAVDLVLKHDDLMSSCKELVQVSCSRGNRDDITVMAVDLSKFSIVRSKEHDL